MISIQDKREAIIAIVSVSKVQFRTDHLLDDIDRLANVFPEPDVFKEVIKQTCHHLELLVKGRYATSQLDFNYNGYDSCHYQSNRKNGQRADLRIAYKKIGDEILVKGFGHRNLPTDFYKSRADRL